MTSTKEPILNAECVTAIKSRAPGSRYASSFARREPDAVVDDARALLQQDFVYRPPYRNWLEALAVVASGLTVTLLVAYIGLSAGVLAGLAVLVAVWVGSVWLLSASGMFLSPFYPSVGVALTVLSLIIARVSFERRRAEIAMRNVESAVLDR